MHTLLPILLILLSALGVACQRAPLGKPEIDTSQPPVSSADVGSGGPRDALAKEQVDFAAISPKFSFSGQVDENLDVELVPQTESVNIYDPASSKNTNLEKSQIFIRFFKASTFLTLNTVNLISQEPDEVVGHAAMRYEIEKKSGVANFPRQPLWRSGRHKLIDIRLEPAGLTYFYVFAYNPDFPEVKFEAFIQSLKFNNDQPPAGLALPVREAQNRITKKPYGIKVSPENSPVNPERFSGFHNAVDFEILPGEETAEVAVYAVCSGRLLQKNTAAGYGGAAVQSCSIKAQPVTVIYGHLRLSSITSQIGENIQAGQRLGVLGQGLSAETDGERKHLHLGIHKGSDIDLRGYVQNESELTDWIDFAEIGFGQ